MLESLKLLGLKLWESAAVRAALKTLAVAVGTVVAGHYGWLEVFGLVAAQ